MSKDDEDIIYTGTVSSIQNGYGFVKPYSCIPKHFNQSKDVYFSTSRVKGPALEKGLFVDFQLSPHDLNNPKVTSIWVSDDSIQTNTTLQEIMPRGESSPSKRNNSAGKNGNSLGKRKHGPGKGENSRSKIDTKPIKREMNQSKRTPNSKGDIEYGEPSTSSGQMHFQSSLSEISFEDIVRGDVFKSQFLGKVCTLKTCDGFGFLKPLQPLPRDYAQDKDVIFYLNRLGTGNFPIQLGDIIGFSLGTKEKARPMAIHTTLCKCVKRTSETIDSFTNDMIRLLTEGQLNTNRHNTTDQADLYYPIVEFLSCEGVVESMGNCPDLTD